MAATQAQIELINRHLPSLGIAPSGDIRTDVNAALGKIVELMNDGKPQAEQIQYDPAVGYTPELGQKLAASLNDQEFQDNIDTLKLLAEADEKARSLGIELDSASGALQDKNIPAPMKETPKLLLKFVGDADNILETLNALNRNGDLTPTAQQEPAQQEPAQQEPAQQEPAQQEPAQQDNESGLKNERKLELAQKNVEGALTKLSEGISSFKGGLVSKFITIPSPDGDGQLNDRELQTLYQGLALLKVTIGIEPANGDYNDDIGKKINEALTSSEDIQKLLSEANMSRAEIQVLLVNLNILEKEGVINHEKAQKVTVPSMAIQALRGFLGDGTVDGFISVVAGFVNSLPPQYAQLVNVFFKMFLGFGLDDLMALSSNKDEHWKHGTTVDFDADPATLQAQLQKVYKEAVERAGGDPVKMKEDILGYVETLNDFRVLASSDEKQQLLDKIGGALDAAGNDPAAFARIVQEAIHNRNEEPQPAPAQEPPAQQQQQTPGTPAGGSTSGGGVKREGSSTGTDKVSLFDDQAQAAMDAYDVEVGFDDTPGAKAAIGVYLVPDGSNVFVFADRNGGLQAQSMTQAELEEFFLTYAENPDSIKVEVLDISDPQRVADLRQTLQGRIKDKFNQESGAIAKAEPEPEPPAKPTPPEQQPPAQPAPAQPPSAQPTPPQEQVRPLARVQSEPSDFDRLAKREGLIELRREVQAKNQAIVKEQQNALTEKFRARAGGSRGNDQFTDNANEVTGKNYQHGLFAMLRRWRDEPDQADPSNPAHQSQQAAQSPYVIDPPR